MKKETRERSCTPRRVGAHGPFTSRQGGGSGLGRPKAFGTWQLSGDHSGVRPPIRGRRREPVFTLARQLHSVAGRSGRRHSLGPSEGHSLTHVLRSPRSRSPPRLAAPPPPALPSIFFRLWLVPLVPSLGCSVSLNAYLPSRNRKDTFTWSLWPERGGITGF